MAVTKHAGPYGTATTGTHVQYQVPAPVRHKNALVLVHGGGGLALDYLATPDGRPGWATLFAQDESSSAHGLIFSSSRAALSSASSGTEKQARTKGLPGSVR